jgi:hypothetical protein
MSTSCRGVRGSGKNKRSRQDAWQVAGRVTDWRRHSWGGGSGWEDRNGDGWQERTGRQDSWPTGHFLCLFCTSAFEGWEALLKRAKKCVDEAKQTTTKVNEAKSQRRVNNANKLKLALDFFEALVLRWAALLGHKMVQTHTRGVADVVQAERWDSTRTGQWAWQLDRGSLVTWKLVLRGVGANIDRSIPGWARDYDQSWHGLMRATASTPSTYSDGWLAGWRRHCPLVVAESVWHRIRTVHFVRLFNELSP